MLRGTAGLLGGLFTEPQATVDRARNMVGSLGRLLAPMTEPKSPLMRERGMALSGGQRQAVVVARALVLDPPMLVLDEPTSHMDNASEAAMKERLERVLPGKTVLLVTHRPSMLSLVDRLIILDGGKVVADGPKDDVLQALKGGRIKVRA